MKSTEVYKILREVLAPWCREHGFKRIKSGMLGWHKRIGQEYLVFWFQCSRDGWDEYAGSKFIVEFQLASEPVIGIGRNRKRLPALLSKTQLDQVLKIQNEVISKLSPPHNAYIALHFSSDNAEYYLARFKPEKRSYRNNDDIWLRYHDEENVKKWGLFIKDNLPVILSRFIPDYK